MANYIPSGTEYAAKILSESKGKFFVYGDPDVDGVFSAFFVCQMLSAFGKDYEIYINENRAHGFFYEDIAALEGRTVIAVDFSIKPEILEQLRQHNVKLVNIDHHDIKDKSLVTYSCTGTAIDGVVINNQYCFEPDDERYLSGAGMVYYVLSNICPSFDNAVSRAVVGITLLSDIRPLESDKARNFLRACYTCKEPYIQYLIDVTRAERDFGFGKPSMERNYVDYTFSPKMNALFRLNMGTTAIDLVMGKKPKFDLDEARQIQNQIRDYIKSKIQSPFNSNGVLQSVSSHLELSGANTMLPNLNTYYMPNETISDQYKLANFIGLTCSQLKGYGKSCIAYIGSDTHIERGSFRGRFDRVDYLDIFKQHGFNEENCAGHANAFGFHDCDLRSIDWIGLNNHLGIVESEAVQVEYENRVVDVSNLQFFTHSDLLKTMAMTNIYVRDSYRSYIRYVGSNVTRRAVGKMWEFLIDGVKVKCFDADITPTNGFILPIYDRGILTYFLKNIKK